MQQPKPTLPSRKFNILRRPSSNTSIESADQFPIVKKKYMMQKNDSSSIQNKNNKPYADFGHTRKLKICDGQKLSYEVIKKNSKQKRVQFLEKYTHDPFMRKKFEKSVEKFSRSKSRQMTSEKKFSSNINGSSRKMQAHQTFTTFREQIIQQSQKTVKLINNCRQLVDELKKNRLTEGQINHNDKKEDQSGRRFSHLETRR